MSDYKTTAPDLICLRNCQFLTLAVNSDIGDIRQRPVNEIQEMCVEGKNTARHKYGAEVVCGLAAKLMIELSGGSDA